MKKRCCVAVIVLLNCPFVQIKSQSFDTPYLGLSAYSNSQVEPLSGSTNVASMSSIHSLSIGLYGERKFMLSELSLVKATLVLPTSSGNFGIAGNYFGFPAYHEAELGFFYARNVGSAFQLGAQFNYHVISIPGYGALPSGSFSIGAILRVTEQFKAGLNFYDPVALAFKTIDTGKPPQTYSFGFGFEPSKKFFIGFDIVKSRGEDVNVDVGLQYNMVAKVYTRVGIASASSTVYFGIGFRLKRFRFDVAATYHPVLGITPASMLIIDKQNEEL